MDITHIIIETKAVNQQCRNSQPQRKKADMGMQQTNTNTLIAAMSRFGWYAIVFAIMGCSVAFVVRFVSSGYELGDHGFYLLHIYQPEFLTFSMTHFGVIWTFFVGHQSIVTNRVLNIGLMLCACIFIVMLSRIVKQPQHGSTCNTPFQLATAIAVAGSCFAYFVWDPNYNSIATILVLLISGLSVVAVESILRGGSMRWMAATFVVGGFMAALLITKISSALFLGVFLTAIAGITAYKAGSWRVFWQILAFAILGFAAFLIVFDLRTHMLLHVMESFFNAKHLSDASNQHSADLITIGAVMRMLNLGSVCMKALVGGGYIIAVPVVASVAACVFFKARLSDRWTYWLVLVSTSIIGMVGAAALWGEPDQAFLRKMMLSIFALGCLLALVLWREVKPSFAGHMLIASSLAGVFWITIGTANTYDTHILGIGPALPLLSVAISLSLSDASRLRMLHTLVLALAALMLTLSGLYAYHFPYRIAGALSEATVPVAFPNNEVLYVTPPIATAITALTQHAFNAEEPAGRPPIFDLTGELPIAVHLLNGKAVGAAWYLDFFEAGFSEAIFARLPPTLFRDGWILIRLDEQGSPERDAPHYHSFMQRLNELHIDFDTQYQQATLFDSPSFGRKERLIRVALYKPRGQ
jgi:hypothetical protein